MANINIIAAISVPDRAIGNNNKLLWHIPEDLEYFKKTTAGCPVIMGRKTFESILGYLGKPLPGRDNIVISRNKERVHPDVQMAESVEEAIAVATMQDPFATDMFIIGGASIYESALPLADKLYLTLVEKKDGTPFEADTFFPPYEHLFTKKISERSSSDTDYNYSFVVLEK